MDPERALRARLKHGYGMTVEDLHGMIDAQAGRCAICAETFSKPAIDHDHATGAVRALLCMRCNNWLAAIEHPTFYESAVRYLNGASVAPVRFRINERWLAQRKQHKAEAKARRLA